MISISNIPQPERKNYLADCQSNGAVATLDPPHVTSTPVFGSSGSFKKTSRLRCFPRIVWVVSHNFLGLDVKLVVINYVTTIVLGGSPPKVELTQF